MTTRSCQPQEAKECDISARFEMGYELNSGYMKGYLKYLHNEEYCVKL